MPESVLTVLKFCFLALLYLFMARVLRAVWVEIFADRRAVAEDIAAQQRRASAEAAATGVRGTAPPVVNVTLSADQGRRRSRRAPAARSATTWTLKVVEPPQRRGVTFQVVDELTIGRAPGCGISIDDTYASQLHARVFVREGQLFVEDLGSTNGTLHNRKAVTSATIVKRGDRIQIGGTILELQK